MPPKGVALLEGMALEGVCHCGMGFEVSLLKLHSVRESVDFLLPLIPALWSIELVLGQPGFLHRETLPQETKQNKKEIQLVTVLHFIIITD